MRISAETINWRVALGELLLIVIGILMALAIDSYAGRRADQAVAAEYLQDLVTELQADADYLEKSHTRIGELIDSASELLEVLESADAEHDDPGGLLVGALSGEGITREPAVWAELQMTGSLRLIENPSKRSAIVSYYLSREASFKTIDENFVPAVRDLRSLAWAILPVDSFGRYLRSGQSGVAGPVVMASLQEREDAVFLLKRVIVTGTVARFSLDRVSERTTNLLAELGAPEPDTNLESAP